MSDRLSQLNPGDSGIVERIDNVDASTRLLTLGILPASKIKLIRKSPLGDCFYIKVRQQAIAIRESEAEAIWISND